MFGFLPVRCSRKHLCRRHSQPNHWLWSFQPTSRCVTVQRLQPASQSRDEQTRVSGRSAPNIDYCWFSCLSKLNWVGERIELVFRGINNFIKLV